MNDETETVIKIKINVGEDEATNEIKTMPVVYTISNS